MFCKECGTQLREGARFCSVCGTAVAASVDQPTMPAQQPIEQAYDQPVHEQQPLPVPDYAQQFQPLQGQGFGESVQQGFSTSQPQGFGQPAQPFGQPTPAEQAFDRLVQQQDSQGFGKQQDSQDFNQQMQTPVSYGQTYGNTTPDPALQQYQSYQQTAPYQQPAQQPYQQPTQQVAPQPIQPGGFPTPAPATTTAHTAAYAPTAGAKKKSSKLLPVLIGAGGLVVIAVVAVIILAVLRVGPFAGTMQPPPPGGGAGPGITASEDTITFMVRVSDNTAIAEQQKVYWQKIADGFHAQNPQITVEIIAVPTSQYATEFDAMSFSGQAPTVFGTGGLPSGQIDDAAYPLDQLLSTLDHSGYLFLSDYEILFPDKNELPTSFDVTIVYVSTSAAANVGITVPDKISSLDKLLENNTPIVVDKTSLPDLLALYNPGVIASSGIALSEEDENQIVRILAADKQSANDSAAGMFTSGAAVYYVGDKSTWWTLGASLSDGVTAIPLENNGAISARFSDTFSVSNAATENQRNAAMLLMAYLISDEAQNELYVANDRHIPINRAVFDSYISANPRFAFLAGRETDIKFYRNSCAELVSFSDKLYDEAILPKMNEESTRSLLNSYRK